MGTENSFQVANAEVMGSVELSIVDCITYSEAHSLCS